MVKEYLLQLGYSKEEIKTILNSYSLCNLKKDTLLAKIKEVYYLLISLGYSHEDVIKMTKVLPSLFGYSIENIKQKTDALISLGYSRDDVIKMTKISPTLFGNLVGQLRFSNYLPEEEVGKHIMRLRQYYDVGFEEATYYVEDRVFYFNFLQDNRAIVRIFPMEDYCKIDPNIKMKEYRYGIIYIRENDEFQMQDIDSAFDYIPDETNDSVIYMREPIPIEIGVKPVKKELLSIEE